GHRHRERAERRDQRRAREAGRYLRSSETPQRSASLVRGRPLVGTFISNLLGGVASALGGFWGYAALGGLALVGGAAGGYYVSHRMDESTIATMQLNDQKALAKALTDAAVYDKKQADLRVAAAVEEGEAQGKLEAQNIVIGKAVPVYVTVSQDRRACLTVGF